MCWMIFHCPDHYSLHAFIVFIGKKLYATQITSAISYFYNMFFVHTERIYIAANESGTNMLSIEPSPYSIPQPARTTASTGWYESVNSSPAWTGFLVTRMVVCSNSFFPKNAEAHVGSLE